MSTVGNKWYTRKLEGATKRCQLPLGNLRLLSGAALPKKQGEGTVGTEDRERIENASGSEEHHRQKF